MVTDFERLPVLVPEALDNWKFAIVKRKIDGIKQRLKTVTSYQEVRDLLEQQQALQSELATLAKLVGERVVNP